MNTLAPIALVQSTELMRRSMLGASGAGGAVRDGADPTRVPAARRRPLAGLVALMRRRRRRVGAAQSGSDQCSMVAAPRKPARA
jgi:hypothetical protein